MADRVSGTYGGSSSGYLIRVRFPRSEFATWPTQDTAAIPPDVPAGLAAVIAFQAAGFRAGQTREWVSEGGLAFAVVTVTTAFDPATSGPAWTFGDRMAGRDQRPRFSENPPPWVPVPIFDPQLWPATQIGGDRTRARPWWTVTQPQPAWVYTAFSDPTLFAAATIQQAGGFRTTARGWWTSGPPDTAWVFTTLPVTFDAATYSPNVQLASGFRLGQTQEWISQGGLSFLATPDVVTAWDPSLAGSWQFGDRLRSRTWWTAEPPEIGWLYPTLPVFDPTGYVAQVEQSLRSFRLGSRAWWTSLPPQDAWIYVAIPPWNPAVAGSWLIAERTRTRAWWSGDQPQIAWWFPTLPVIEETPLIRHVIYHYKHHH